MNLRIVMSVVNVRIDILVSKRKFKNSISIVAHPGWSITSLQHRATGYTTIFGFLPYMRVLNTLFAQPADIGAYPQLYAALHPGLAGARLWDPNICLAVLLLKQIHSAIWV